MVCATYISGRTAAMTPTNDNVVELHNNLNLIPKSQHPDKSMDYKGLSVLMCVKSHKNVQTQKLTIRFMDNTINFHKWLPFPVSFVYEGQWQILIVSGSIDSGLTKDRQQKIPINSLSSTTRNCVKGSCCKKTLIPKIIFKIFMADMWYCSFLHMFVRLWCSCFTSRFLASNIVDFFLVYLNGVCKSWVRYWTWLWGYLSDIFYSFIAHQSRSVLCIMMQCRNAKVHTHACIAAVGKFMLP